MNALALSTSLPPQSVITLLGESRCKSGLLAVSVWKGRCVVACSALCALQSLWDGFPHWGCSCVHACAVVFPDSFSESESRESEREQDGMTGVETGGGVFFWGRAVCFCYWLPEKRLAHAAVAWVPRQWQLCLAFRTQGQGGASHHLPTKAQVSQPVSALPLSRATSPLSHSLCFPL